MNKIFDNFSRSDLRIKAVKAILKSLFVFGVYFLVMYFLGAMFAFVPGFLVIFQAFVVLFVVFVIIGEFAAKTIFQPVVNGVRASLVLVYMVSGFDSGVLSLTMDNVTLTMDLGLFFSVGVVLSLMGIVVSVMEFFFFLNRRAESQAGLLQVEGKS